jgi:hypothetical protein
MINQSILRKVLIVGTALLLAAGGAKAFNPFMPRYHTVMVKTSPGIQSIYVYGTWGVTPYTHIDKLCNGLNPTPGWYYTAFMALNGTDLQVITFTTPDCSHGEVAGRILTIPRYDGLTNVWVDASQPGFSP